MTEKRIAEFKQNLDDRSRFILEKRIPSDSPLTLRAIGLRFGISRKRVRQLTERIVNDLTRHIKRTVSREAA